MRLARIEIHNFRGIHDANINVFDYTILVGPNNAGKSTVIDALRVFYEKGIKFNSTQDFPKVEVSDAESWIELTFLLTEPEHESLSEEYAASDRLLHLRKYLVSAKKNWPAGTIYARLVSGELSEKAFYGAKNVQSGKIGELIFVPAVSKVDDHTKLSGPSALRDLVSGIMSGVVEGSEAYDTLTGSIQSFSVGIKQMTTEDDQSLAGFEADLNELLAPWHTKFSLNLGTPSAADIVKSMVDWTVTEEQCGAAQDISYFGSGFQRHFIYSLIRLAAKYLPTKDSKKTKDFTPRLNLVLFEEPEAFLHPPQQEELSRSLAAMAGADDWQVICSTHSSHFVSRNMNRIPSIVRLLRSEGVITAHQIDKDTWDTIIDANQAVNIIAQKYPTLKKRLAEDDTKAEIEAVRYTLWLNPDRASMFFSNHVLLVEGPSEVALLNRLLDDGLIDLPAGVYVLDCIGKLNMHRFMNLLGATAVRHSVLHDDDDDADYHKEANQLIADSANAHTTGISSIPGNLEKYLGLPRAGSPHRKPQHIMYCYSDGKIDGEQLKQFCKLARACMC